MLSLKVKSLYKLNTVLTIAGDNGFPLDRLPACSTGKLHTTVLSDQLMQSHLSISAKIRAHSFKHRAIIILWCTVPMLTLHNKLHNDKTMPVKGTIKA